jgi:hypothetical protein
MVSRKIGRLLYSSAPSLTRPELVFEQQPAARIRQLLVQLGGAQTSRLASPLASTQPRELHRATMQGVELKVANGPIGTGIPM